MQWLRLFLIFLCCTTRLSAQGVYAEFGQNRVQFTRFDWKFYSDRNIDVYFYSDGEALARNALEMARDVLPRVEKILAYRLSGSMQLMVFNNLNEYRQSNLGYSNPQFDAGGYTVIPDDKAAIYFNGDYHFLNRQIRSSITDILLREMMFGGTLQERIQNSALLVLPPWFIAGLKSYIGEEWNAEMDNRMRDATGIDRFRHFNSLNEEETELAGHSLWKYIMEQYGQDALTNVIYMTRITRSVESAVYFVTQQRLGELIQSWRDHYKGVYANEPKGISLPQGSENTPERLTRLRNTQFKISPDGKNLAVVTHDKGSYRVWLYDTRNKHTQLLYRGGYKVLNQIPDYQFPIIAWHPGGKRLGIITDEKGRYELLELPLGNGTRKRWEIAGFTGFSDFVYAEEGRIYLSAVRNGQSDLYSFQLNSGEYVGLTDDAWFDHSLRLDPSGQRLFFVSNRPPLERKMAEGTENVFSIASAGGKVRAHTAYDSGVRVSQPFVLGNDQLVFLSDVSGIVNSWATRFGDSIYEARPLTNYRRNILYQDYTASGDLLAEMLLIDGRYRIFFNETGGGLQSVDITRLDWRKRTRRLESAAREAAAIRGAAQALPDSLQAQRSSNIDTSGYQYLTGFDHFEYQSPTDTASPFNGGNQTENLAAVAENRFTIDYFLSQLDNSLLGAYYYSNEMPPSVMQYDLISPYVSVSISDLFRNFNVEAGMRVNTALNSSDILFKASDLRHRLDKQLSVIRRSLPQDALTEGFFRRNQSTTADLKFLYPFTERSRITLSLMLRHERIITKATSLQTLPEPSIEEFYAGIRTRYVLDNTRSEGLNRMRGLRFKAYGDYLHFFGGAPLLNLGFDLRHYQPVHRQITLATRLTGAASPGGSQVAYYLGAMENWIRNQNQFESGLALLGDERYRFQTYAANLRGFYRNIRAGNHFLLANIELRVPIVSYLYQKPVRAEFWRNLMLTGFVDGGTAWTGSSPWSRDNPFNTRIINGGNYVVTVTSQRNPFVLGSGFGLRSRIMGYYVKFDRAWGYSERVWNEGMSYFTLGLDF